MADKNAAPLVADDFPEPEPTIVRSRAVQRYEKQMQEAVRESQTNAAAQKPPKDPPSGGDAPAPPASKQPARRA